MQDHSEGARPFMDIGPAKNPEGKSAHDLPHRFLPDDPSPYREPSDVCQFTAGGQRCQGTRREHAQKWSF